MSIPERLPVYYPGHEPAPTTDRLTRVDRYLMPSLAVATLGLLATVPSLGVAEGVLGVVYCGIRLHKYLTNKA